jgi:hypothetical protein
MADKRGREGILRLHITDKKIRNIRTRQQMFFYVTGVTGVYL